MAVAAIFTAYTAGAQVETSGATTNLSVEWTQPETDTVQSDNILMLSGESDVNFTIINTTDNTITIDGKTYDNTYIRYINSVEIQDANGNVKAGPVYYRFVRDENGNGSYQYSTGRTQGSITLDLSSKETVYINRELGRTYGYGWDGYRYYYNYNETSVTWPSSQTFDHFACLDNDNPAYYSLTDAVDWENYMNSNKYYTVDNNSWGYGHYLYANAYGWDAPRNHPIYNYNWGEAQSGNSISGTLHVTNGADGDRMVMSIFFDDSQDNPKFTADQVVVYQASQPGVVAGAVSYNGNDYPGYYYTSGYGINLTEPFRSDGMPACGNGCSSELSSLSTTTKRYDIYDDKPLWNKSGETTATDAASILSNRMNAKSHSDEISVYVHRKLVSGSWSTLCLPFDIKMSDLQNDNALGHNVKISEFQNVDVANGIVNFKSITDNTTTLKAGKPYLFYYQGENKDAFFAPNVKFDYTAADNQTALTALSNRKSTTTSNGYYYTGVLEPLTNDATVTTEQLNGGCIVYIAAPAEGSTEQHLKRLKEDGKIKAFRAYLYYPKSGATNAAQGKGIISIDSELNDPTAITKVMVDGKQVSNRIYNLQGQCVGTEPGQLPAGVYVRNGKKFVVK